MNFSHSHMKWKIHSNPNVYYTFHVRKIGAEVEIKLFLIFISANINYQRN